MMKSGFIYNAAIYARLSRDDNSVGNQIELIRDYLKSTPEIRVVSVREDNGFSGVDFLRPAFVKMMNDIKNGIINCVIVKDLSRLGRNYIEVGELMEKVFPEYNTRLISVNDRYDSLNPKTDADEILIPFKNLFNEQYLRDSSVKIRSGLDIRRKNGDFIAAFAPYGYKRDINNRHKLVIDVYPSGVVSDIFKWKIEGVSLNKIAERLNRFGEPSPSEYKKRDTNYIACFQTQPRALWSAVAVGRIIRNPVYTGVLIQGRQTTPNFKVKKRIIKPDSEWHIIRDAHESVISGSDFEIANNLLNQDSRTAPDKETVYALSGLVYCGVCGKNMIRSKSGKFFYYICASGREKNKTCGSRCICIRQEKLENAVKDAVAEQIAHSLDFDKSFEYIKKLSLSLSLSLSKNLNSRISDRENEIKSCEKYRLSLCDDYKNNIISEKDYIDYEKIYADRIEELKKASDKLREKAESEINCGFSAYEWLNYFINHGNMPELDRKLAARLIERINIFDKKRVEIKFNYELLNYGVKYGGNRQQI